MHVVRRVAGIALVAMSALAVPTAQASARSYYEYWSYWHKPPGATAWQYSNVGASGYYLKSGTQVEGWRFDVGTASPSDPQPRPTSASYDTYCAGKNTDKTYRVLLVVDYGTASNAPGGPVYSCYGFNDDVNGFQVLTQQHSERDQSGLVCAIDSYPRSGCGEVVSSPAPKKPTPQPTVRHTTSRRTTTTATTPVPTHTAQSPTPTKAPTHKASSVATPTQSSDPTSPASSSAPALRPFTAAPAASQSSFPVGLVLAVAGVVALGGGAWFLRRRAG